MFGAGRSRKKDWGHGPCKRGFEDALDVVWVVLRSGSGEATTANFDSWKMSVRGAGFAHGDVLDDRTAEGWVNDVVSDTLVIIPRNLVTRLG